MSLLLNMDPIVSIVTCAYNASAFIQECIESILQQTFEDFEWIILDDASTDDTYEIIEKYKDKRIRLYKNEKNLDIPKSLNRAIPYAKGMYIARIDADDIALPNRLEKQIEYFRNNSTVDILASTIQRIDENKNYLSDWKEDIKNISHEQIITTLAKTNCIGNSSIMIKADVLKKHMYNETLEYSEDYELWLRLANQGYRFFKIPEPLVLYRIHDSSITSTTTKKYRIFIKKTITIKQVFLKDKRFFHMTSFERKVWFYLQKDKWLLIVKKIKRYFSTH